MGVICYNSGSDHLCAELIKLPMKKIYLSFLLALTGVVTSTFAQENRTIHPKSSKEYDRQVTFTGDVIINNLPGENQQKPKVTAAFNGWLYSAYTTVNTSTGNGGITIRSSRDNGATWSTIDAYSVAGVQYTDFDLTVAGTDTNNLRLFLVGLRFDTGTSTYILFVDQYNATTGAFNGDYYNMDHGTSPIRDVAIATDYASPSVSSSPYSVGIMYSAGASLDSIVHIASLDAGMTYTVRNTVALSSAWYRGVALSYGRSASGSNGRFFGAWEELTAYGNVNAHIWSSRSQNDVSSTWITPVNLDSVSFLMINKCKNPSIATSYGLVDNDSGSVSAVVLVQRDYTGTGGDYDLLGFYNKRAHYANYWSRLDIDNSGSSNSIEPSIAYAPGTTDFYATYFDSTAHHLTVIKNNYNLASASSWNTVTNKYNDDTLNVIHPSAHIDVNPANNKAAMVWIRMNGSEGVAMFDAEYATTVGIAEQHGGGNDFSNLYPNPSRDELNISFVLQNDEQVSFQVINMLGESVMAQSSESFGTGAQTIKLDVSSLNNGIYFCNVTINGKVYTKKFMVQH